MWIHKITIYYAFTHIPNTIKIRLYDIFVIGDLFYQVTIQFLIIFIFPRTHYTFFADTAIRMYIMYSKSINILLSIICSQWLDTEVKNTKYQMVIYKLIALVWYLDLTLKKTIATVLVLRGKSK